MGRGLPECCHRFLVWKGPSGESMTSAGRSPGWWVQSPQLPASPDLSVLRHQGPSLCRTCLDFRSLGCKSSHPFSPSHPFILSYYRICSLLALYFMGSSGFCVSSPLPTGSQLSLSLAGSSSHRPNHPLEGCTLVCPGGHPWAHSERHRIVSLLKTAG